MPELSDEKLQFLQDMARRVRRHVVETISNAQVGHPGGSLSETDILVALFFHVLRVDPQRPKWEDRDRFILSKGHGAVGLYSTLAERGYFPVDLLRTFGRFESGLQVHPDMHKLPGIEISSGALGVGLSAALGMALAARLDGKSFRVYCVIGDGENQEGQIWEAAAAAAQFKVDNLTAILDYNRVQLTGPMEKIIELAPIAAKWRDFNWEVLEIDGHDMRAVVGALERAQQVKGRPTMIVAHTVKGKGVSYMEGQYMWHGKPPNKEQLAQALAELAG